MLREDLIAFANAHACEYYASEHIIDHHGIVAVNHDKSISSELVVHIKKNCVTVLISHCGVRIYTALNYAEDAALTSAQQTRLCRVLDIIHTYLLR